MNIPPRKSSFLLPDVFVEVKTFELRQIATNSSCRAFYAPIRFRERKTKKKQKTKNKKRGNGKNTKCTTLVIKNNNNSRTTIVDGLSPVILFKIRLHIVTWETTVRATVKIYIMKRGNYF